MLISVILSIYALFRSVYFKLKLNPCTNLGVFIQVYPSGSVSTLNNPIHVAIARQLHFKGAFTHGQVVKGVGHLGNGEAMEVVSSASMAEWLKAWDTLPMMKLWRS